MTVFEIEAIVRNYRNNGQHLEQALRYALTGLLMKADNNEGADIGDIQIKSARATICRGCDILDYVMRDEAKQYAYITKDYKVYLMDKVEYTLFATAFATKTVDSQKNGGAEKMRFKHETKRLLAWLECHA